MGRFPQPDSVLPNIYEPQWLSRYSYVGNNPINHTDPTGHEYGGEIPGCGLSGCGGGGGSGGSESIPPWFTGLRLLKRVAEQEEESQAIVGSGRISSDPSPPLIPFPFTGKCSAR